MNASERLLKLEHRRLECWSVTGKSKYCVSYQGADVYGYPGYISVFGIGDSFESACQDYIDKISGKTLVFNVGRTNEERVTVLL